MGSHADWNFGIAIVFHDITGTLKNDSILYGTAIPESGRRAERSNGKSGICRRIYRTGFEITEHRNRSYARYVDKDTIAIGGLLFISVSVAGIMIMRKKPKEILSEMS